MLAPFVSARDYQDYGASPANEIDELRKALAAGNDIVAPATAPGEGFPLRPQSLESMLKNLTFEMDEIKLFKTIPKVPATNTVEEFNRLLSYSASGSRTFNQGFIQEGDLPEEQDSTYQRVYVLIKYLGVTGRVTHVANTIRAAHGNVIALETMNKTMDLLKNLENALFFGDSTLIPEQFDGLYKLIGDGAPTNVIDLRGATLSEPVLNDVLLRIRDNYGMATDGYFATGAFADLAKEIYDRQRFGVAPQPGVLGASVTAFQGQHGKIALHDHVFIQPSDTPATSALGNAAKRPLSPTISVQPANGANAASLFITADAGTYIYQVVAGNRFGVSASVTTSAVTLVAGDAVTMTVADGGQGTTYYEIYRSVKGGAAGTSKLITRVAKSGASQVVTDLNSDLPNTSKGFVLMQNAKSFSWAQLLPLTRIPLATVDTSLRWAQVLYGAVKMYTPAKNVVIKNIGRAAGSVA